MARKGQITTYMIIGIIILAIALTIFYLLRPAEQEIKQTVQLSQEAQTVKKFIDSCLDMTAKGGTLFLASQGGYFYPPENFLKTNYSNIPYYYLKGNSSAVSEDQLNQNLKDFIEEAVPRCAKTVLKDYDATEGITNATITMDDEQISIKLIYPITLNFGERQETMREFEGTYNIRIETLRRTAEQLTQEISKEPQLTPITYMLQKERESQVRIVAYERGNDTRIYAIVDNQSINAPMLYVFAAKT